METRIFIVLTISLMVWNGSALYSQTPTIEFPMANITEVALNRELIFSAEGNKIALNSALTDQSTHMRLFNLNGQRLCNGSDLKVGSAKLAIWPYGEGLIIKENKAFQGFSQVHDDCEGVDHLVNLSGNTDKWIALNYNSKTYLAWTVQTDNNSIVNEYDVQTKEQITFTTRDHEKWRWIGYSPDHDFLYARTSFNNSENITQQKVVVHKLGNLNQTIDHEIITDIEPGLIFRNGAGFLGSRVDNHDGQNITKIYKVNSTGGQQFLYAADQREREFLLCTKNDHLVIVKFDNNTTPLHSWIEVYDTKEGTLLQNFTYGLIPIPPIGFASVCNDEHLAIYGVDNHLRIFTFTNPTPDEGGVAAWVIILIIAIVVLLVVAGVVWKVKKGKAKKDQYEKFGQEDTV